MRETRAQVLRGSFEKRPRRELVLLLLLLYWHCHCCRIKGGWHKPKYRRSELPLEGGWWWSLCRALRRDFEVRDATRCGASRLRILVCACECVKLTVYMLLNGCMC